MIKETKMKNDFPMTVELVGPGGRLSTATVFDALSLASELDYLSTLIKPGDTIRFLSEED